MQHFVFIFGLIFFQSDVFASTTYKLNLNWKPEPQFGGFYEAQRLGKFKLKQGEVKIFEGGSGTPTIQMLQNGQTDLAIVSAEEILLANERDPKKQIIAVFAVYQKNPQIIMTREDSGLNSIEDIFKSSGILAVQQGLSYFRFLEKKHGKPKVKIVPYQGGVGIFVQNKNYSQQGFATSEPLNAEKSGVKVKVFAIADEGFNPYTTVVAVRAEDLKSKKEVLTQIIAGVRVGWESYLKSPDAANDQMRKLNPSMDAETFKKSAQIQIPYIQTENYRVGEMKKDRWEQLLQQLLDLKVLKTKQNIDGVFQNL